MQRFSSLLPYVLRQWRWLAVIFVLTSISVVTGVLQPWPMKLLVDYALGDADVPAVLTSSLEAVSLSPTPTVLLFCAAASSVGLFAVNSALGVALSLSWSLGGQRMVYDLADDLFGHLQRLSLLFHSRRNIGDSLCRLSDDTWCLYSVTDGLLMAPFQQLFTLVALGGVAFALDPLLASLALAMAPMLAASSLYFGKRMKRPAKRGRETKSRVVSFVHQTLGAIPVVQAFGTEERNKEHFDRLADDAVVLAQRVNLLGSTYGLVNGLITTAGSAAILYVGSTRVLAGAISLGTLLVFLAYVRKMQLAAGGLLKVFTKLKTAEASMDRVLEVMESDERVHESPHAAPLPESPRGPWGHVCLRQVTFGYEPDRPVLTNICLEARPGEVVAIVGPTGAGKSTLVSLIPRFFDPWDGAVTLDGADLRDVPLESLRARVAVVLQEPFLLPLSVAENIAYGDPAASREQIEVAAVAANADEFIRGLPDGYDSVIGESGCTLSGGERQRLSIARALMKDAPVLILDEPTSALDAETEACLMEALHRLMESRTTFIIAHRLSTIRRADRIAVLNQGQIIELGNHEQLHDSDGLYRRLYQQQFGLPCKVVA